MAEKSVVVDELRREFKVPVRQAGLRESAKSLFKREFRQVVAVDDIAFELDAGEVVGFLGPNGAGKTTTLKMLSGLLYPDSGKVEVLGHVPSKRERSFLKRMALVMGNRTSMAWDLPALDSYLLVRAIYEIPKADFERRRDEYIELLDLGEVVNKPVRNLSLGERMKVELAGALLHQPEVIFLDEPTLGLDVTMQRRLHEFVTAYNRRYGATVLLTSYYMADVVALAQRVIVIHHGTIIYDGDLGGLTAQFTSEKTITIHAVDLARDLTGFGTVIEQSDAKAVLQVRNVEASAVAARLLSDFDVSDVTIEDPPLEDVIERMFESEQERP